MPLQHTTFETTEWLPDIHDPKNKGLRYVSNAIPTAYGFAPIGRFVPNTTPVGADGSLIGAYWGRNSGGRLFNFVGSNKEIFALDLDNRTWVKLNATDTEYTAIGYWSFTQQQSKVIATARGVNSPLIYDLDTALSSDGEGGLAFSQKFSPLAGAPLGEYVASVRNHVVLANIENNETRVHWSGLNDSSTWTPSLATQSGFQDLSDRWGSIRAIVPGAYGVIFQEHAITRMTPVSPPVTFRFDVVVRDVGTLAPQSVCWYGEQIFFYAPSGFHVLRGGKELVPIGNDRVDRWVRNNIADTRALRGVVSPEGKYVLWSASTVGGAGYDKILVYKWDQDVWSLIDERHQLLSTYVGAGTDLESVDDFIFTGTGNEQVGNIDQGAQIPFDDPFWEGGTPGFYLFNMDEERGTFSGPSAPAVFTTGFLPLGGYDQLFVNSVRPLIEDAGSDCSGCYVRVRSKDSLATGEIRDEDRAVLRLDTGEASFRIRGRYFEISMETVGSFRGFSGFNVYARKAGRY